MSGYIISQRWSSTLRRGVKKWDVRDFDSKRILHTSSSYAAAAAWIRKRK